MFKYLSKRLFFMLGTLLMASVIIFSITQLLPGDVARMILGRWATDAAVENLRLELGLDRPVIAQYLDWLRSFAIGDWGKSFISHQEIKPIIMGRLRNSIMLASLSILAYVPLGILLGAIAAVNNEKPIDRVIAAVSMAFTGLPAFVTGTVLIGVFALDLGLLPANSSIDAKASFFEAFPRLILPAITVGLGNLGHITRMTRASMVGVLQKDYVMAAVLKGLPRRQIYLNHVLRNALLPTVTVIAMSIGYLIGGMVVTEAVFGYPGLGRYLIFSIRRNDLPSIQASTMIILSIFIISNFIADLLYVVLNPRIRLG